MTKYEPGTVCWLTVMGEGYPSRYCIIKDKLPFNKYRVIFCNTFLCITFEVLVSYIYKQI